MIKLQRKKTNKQKKKTSGPLKIDIDTNTITKRITAKKTIMGTKKNIIFRRNMRVVEEPPAT